MGLAVAPTLQVDISGTPQTYVIDPSLFNDPVTLATWKGVQGDPNATLTPSSADIFYYWGKHHRSHLQPDQHRARHLPQHAQAAIGGLRRSAAVHELHDQARWLAVVRAD